MTGLPPTVMLLAASRCRECRQRRWLGQPGGHGHGHGAGLDRRDDVGHGVVELGGDAYGGGGQAGTGGYGHGRLGHQRRLGHRRS